MQGSSGGFSGLLLLFLSAAGLECPQVKHDLPPLQLRNSAERRHTTIRISVRDFPEQRAIALVLDNRKLQIGCFLQTLPRVSVTFHAIAFEKLPASGRQTWLFRQRIVFRRRFLRRAPPGIWLIVGVL